MKFSPLPIAGAVLVQTQPQGDARGSFARLWCKQTFAAAGIHIDIEQASASFNHQAGTLRGLHFAWPPAQEGKLVRCARGRAFDVLLDLRPLSASYRRWFALELSVKSADALYIPPGVAHGFQTLENQTELHYMMSQAYQADLATGVRFDDPAFGVPWPLPARCLSERDATYPDFDEAAHCARFEAAAPGEQHAA